MLDFLVTEKRLSRDLAYILASDAVDLRITQVAIVEVRFVPNLEILQAVAQRPGHKDGFLGSALRRIGAHVDAI